MDSAGVPIIGGVDALLITLAAREPKEAYWAAMWAILGSVAGSIVLFFIARKGGEVLLSKHISSRRGAKLHAWFQHYGLITVFIPAISPLPLPMKVPVFCAGALGVRTASFIVVVFFARAIRYLALAYFGRRYGIETFTFLRTHLAIFAAIAVALAVLFFLAIWVLEKYEIHADKVGP